MLASATGQSPPSPEQGGKGASDASETKRDRVCSSSEERANRTLSLDASSTALLRLEVKELGSSALLALAAFGRRCADVAADAPIRGSSLKRCWSAAHAGGLRIRCGSRDGPGPSWCQ